MSWAGWTGILARLRRPRTAGPPPASRPDPGFLGALRRESDVIGSSFEEDGLLEAVLDRLEHNRSAEAIRIIRESLACSHSDARILAREVARAARRVKERASG